MHRFWLLAACAGLVSAAAFMAGLTGSMPLVILANFAPAPLLGAAFGLGALGGIVASVTSALLVLVAGGINSAIVFALATAVPAAILGRQIMLSRQMEDGTVEWYPQDYMLVWLFGIGVASFGALALFLAGQSAGFAGTVHAAMTEMANVFQVKEKELFIAATTPLLPGLAIAAWMLLLVVNGAVAQGLLVKGKMALRPSPDIAALYVPNWMAPAGAAIALAAILLGGDAGYAARNLVVVIAVPFFLQGIGVVHMTARAIGAGTGLLAVFYVMLMVIGWVAFLIALLGLVEQFLKIRSRISNRLES